MLSRFTSNQSGQVAVIFAFCLLPICLVVGFSLDQQTQISRKYSVQAALDAAVLAAARSRQTGSNNAEVRADLISFITPHIDTLPGLDCDPPSISIPATSQEIEAEIEPQHNVIQQQQQQWNVFTSLLHQSNARFYRHQTLHLTCRYW